MVAPEGTKITAVFRFQMSKDGKFSGSSDIPEQGQSGIPLSNVVLEGNEVSLKIAGAVKQGGQEMKLSLTKGKYEFPGFALPAEDMKRLLGL